MIIKMVNWKVNRLNKLLIGRGLIYGFLQLGQLVKTLIGFTINYAKFKLSSLRVILNVTVLLN